ncbi:MAG: nitroreductase family protein [Rhodospirillales bacterium]
MATIADLYKDRFGVPPEHAHGEQAAGTIESLLSRRSYRHYRSDPVPDDVLETLLACAQSAPAKSDLQQYSIIVLKDEDVRQAVFELNPKTLWFAQAPVALVFCGDMRRGQRAAAWKGYDYANNTVDTFMNAAVDAALAMMSFITAAESIGLGCCAISNVRTRVQEISTLLKLPEGVYPVAGLTAGWPEGEAILSMRLPPAAVVHEDRYDDSNLEAELSAYDERRNARRPMAPDRQVHKDKYGISEHYGWSENAARRLSVQEREDFTPYLKRQGFELK